MKLNLQGNYLMETKIKEKKESDGIVEVVLTIPIATTDQRKTFLKYWKNYPGQIKCTDLVQQLK